MNPTYPAKLGLIIWKTEFDIQKIDGLTLVTYKMMLVGFSVQNKLEKVWFLDETFILADISMEVVLEMSFCTLPDINVQFVEKKLKWKSYTTAKALPITKRVELIDKQKFATTALDKNTKTFVIHVIILSARRKYTELSWKIEQW